MIKSNKQIIDKNFKVYVPAEEYRVRKKVLYGTKSYIPVQD